MPQNKVTKTCRESSSCHYSSSSSSSAAFLLFRARSRARYFSLASSSLSSSESPLLKPIRDPTKTERKIKKRVSPEKKSSQIATARATTKLITTFQQIPRIYFCSSGFSFRYCEIRDSFFSFISAISNVRNQTLRSNWLKNYF